MYWARTPAPERKYFYSSRSLAAATKARDAYLKQRPASVASISSGSTWKEWAAAWLTSERTRVRPRTAEKWEDYTDLHVTPILGPLALSRIETKHIVAVLDACKLAPATKAGVRYAMLRAFEFAVDLGLIASNPVANKACKPPRIPKTPVRPMPHEAFRAFVTAIEGHRHAALLRLYVLAGLRRGEALGLAWCDINWQASTARIARTVQRAGKRLVLAPVKTDAGVRTIPLDADTVSALRERRRIQLEHRMKMGEHWTESDLVFTSTRGTLQEPRNVYRMLQGVLTTAGLSRVSVHALRHTAATNMIAAGVDPRTVIEVFGWSSIRMLDRYAHAIPERLSHAREAMATAGD